MTQVRGKDLFAYACHQASPRAGKPYLGAELCVYTEDAVESELFGHVSGREERIL